MKVFIALAVLGFLIANVNADCNECLAEHCAECIPDCVDPEDPACYVCLLVECLAECIPDCIVSIMLYVAK